MRTISRVAILLTMLATLSLPGCKKEGEKPATPPVDRVRGSDAAPAAVVAPVDEPMAPGLAAALDPLQPKPVEDAADEYDALAKQVIADFGKEDFAAFVKNSMVSREQLKAMMEAGWEICPEMAPSEEQRPQMEKMLADYDLAGEAVKAGFDGCVAKHKFAKATLVSASSREHLTLCGGEMADHVEVTLALGKEQIVVVLDALVKTSEGWRLLDSGLSCLDPEAGE